MNNNPGINESNVIQKHSFLSGLSFPNGTDSNPDQIQQNPYSTLIETVKQHYNVLLEFDHQLDEEKKQKKTIQSHFEKFLLEMFEVADFFEGVLENAEKENVNIKRDKDMMDLIKNFQQGLQLLLKKFASIDVEPYIPELGSPFIPGKNYSVGTQKSETLPEKTIGKVVKKGYTWKGQLLRPAYVLMVKN
jgi:molecular chaperone GrpE (heat shock protein)